MARSKTAESQLRSARYDKRQTSLYGRGHEKELQRKKQRNAPSDVKRRQTSKSRSKAATAVRSILKHGPHVTVIEEDFLTVKRTYPKTKDPFVPNGTHHMPKAKTNGKPVPLKPARLTKKAAQDLEVYQVFRDGNGIAYLRTGYTHKGALFVVNKGFSVELVEIDARSTQGHYLAMNPVTGASIVECAKRLLRPLNDNVTISTRARVELEKILENKELQMKATAPAAVPTRPAKFATVPAPRGRAAAAPVPATRGRAAAAAPAPRGRAAAQPPARGRAAQAAAKPARGRAAAAETNGGGFRGRGDDVVIAKVKQNPCREGTFCFGQVEAAMQGNGKTVEQVQAILDKGGYNPNGRRLEVSWLESKGYIQTRPAK